MYYYGVVLNAWCISNCMLLLLCYFVCRNVLIFDIICVVALAFRDFLISIFIFFVTNHTTMITYFSNIWCYTTMPIN